jgi:acyl-CoA thioester hydrolase
MNHEQKPTTFTCRVRVYYEDTDAGGVIYYANYLKYLERCRTEWLRSIGYRQTDLLRDPGIAFVVRKLTIEYLKPARLDDELIVGLEVENISRAQIFFRQHIGAPAKRRRVTAGVDPCRRAHRLRQCGADESAVSIPAILRNKLEALQ